MAFSTGNPQIDAIMNGAIGSNNLDTSSKGLPSYISDPTLNQVPGVTPASSSGGGNWNPNMLPENIIINKYKPDPSKQEDFSVPAQPNLPTAKGYPPQYLSDLRAKAHAEDTALYGGRYSANIDQYFDPMDITKNSNKDIYAMANDVKEIGTTTKQSVEATLRAYAAIQDQIGSAPLKELETQIPDWMRNAANKIPGVPKVSDQAAIYEQQLKGSVPELKNTLTQAGVRLNQPLLEAMASYLPSISNDPEKNRQGIINLNSQMISKLGIGIDQKLLDSLGIKKKDVYASLGEKAIDGQKPTQDLNQPMSGGTSGGQGGGPEMPNLPEMSANTQKRVSEYQSDSQNLIKQAEIEQDPQKKSNYLSQSRLLDGMAEKENEIASYTNPIMGHLAETQKFLADTPILDIVQGAIGAFALGPLGAGMEGYLSSKEHQALSNGTPQSLLPKPITDPGEQSALTNGAKLAAMDLLFLGVGKLLRPIKAVSELRGAASAAENVGETNIATQIAGGATGHTNPVYGDQIVEGVDKWVNGDGVNSLGVPASMKDQALKFLEDVKGKYAGKILDIDGALAEKTNSWGRGYTIANQEGRPVAATGERVVSNLIKDQLPQSVKNYDKVLTALYSTQNAISKNIWPIARGALKLGGGIVLGKEAMKTFGL